MFCKKCGAELNDGAKFCVTCGTPTEVQPAKKARPKWLIPAVIAAAVLLVALVAMAICGPMLSNGISKAVKEPGEYYADIEYKNLSAVIDVTEDNKVDLTDMKVDGGLTVKLEEGGKKLLKDMLGVDLNEYITGVELGLDFTTAMKKDQMQMDLGLLLNGTDLISAAVMMDLAAGEMYMDIPLVYDNAWRFDLKEMFADDDSIEFYGGEGYLALYREMMNGSGEMMEAIYGILPLVKDYMKVAADNMVPFEKSSETLEVGDLSAKYTVLTANVTEKQLAKTVRSVLVAMRNDKRLDSKLEALLKSFEYAMDEGELEEALRDFRDGLDEMITDLEEIEKTGDDVEVLFVYRVWMNNKGEIMGRELRAPEEELVVSLYNVIQSGKQNTEFVLISEDDRIELSGAAKRSGDVLKNGEYTLTVTEYGDKIEMLEIAVEKLDLAKWEKGESDLALTLTFGRDIGEMMDSEMLFLRDIALKITAKGNSKNAKMTEVMLYDDAHIATVTFDGKQQKAGSIKPPKDAVDFTDDMAYELDIEAIVNELVDRLTEAGLDEELAQMIPQLVVGSGY